MHVLACVVSCISAISSKKENLHDPFPLNANLIRNYPINTIDSLAWASTFRSARGLPKCASCPEPTIITSSEEQHENLFLCCPREGGI